MQATTHYPRLQLAKKLFQPSHQKLHVMTIYNEIFKWGKSKDLWIQDALRLIVTQSEVSDEDINRLLLLLKKETGFTYIKNEPKPLSENDIPTEITENDNPITLLSIENPKNINALHSESSLAFNPKGLNIIYGDNGTGKSGFSRILKKTCWSRDRDITLKKDIFTINNVKQQVTIKYSDNNNKYEFNWSNDASIPKELNLINVFDIKCANLYINSENSTEYKPVGLDVLEMLLEIFKRISEKLDVEIGKLNTEKPFLDNKYNETEIYSWYTDIENKKREELNQRILFTEANQKRLSELTTLLAKTSPEKENIDLTQKINRYWIVLNKIIDLENALKNNSVQEYINFKNDYKAKKDAYTVASQKFSGDDPLEGVGSATWRQLWESAKEFAITEVHPEIEDFPADLSEEYCVFCQQKLDDTAKKRIKRFELFISDTTSSEFKKINKQIDQLINNLSNKAINIDSTIDELDSEIEDFKNTFIQFRKNCDTTISSITSKFRNKEQKIEYQKIEGISGLVKSRIEDIEKTIKTNLNLISERKKVFEEHNELTAIKILFNQKDKISKYYEEDLKKYWLNKAKAKTNTRLISQKIGEIQEDKAINEQLVEFKKHLSNLNKKLTDKVVLKKTRTIQGETYQQCTFQDQSDNLNDILSEGEQKLITLSNFISESTIGGSKKSLVIDDPVTSLDQNYKEKIAQIMVNLSVDRQVIILTHDLNFVRLLIDESNKLSISDYKLIGLNSTNGISGIVSDEIPYLVKNIQERIDSIRILIKEIKGISPTQIDKKEEKVAIASKRFRFLLEKSVEDILANKSIQRFSKNINLKAKPLSGYVVTEKSDIDFILKLFNKYSVPEHDGGVPSEYQKPTLDDIIDDLVSYEKWKTDFVDKQNQFIKSSGY